MINIRLRSYSFAPVKLWVHKYSNVAYWTFHNNFCTFIDLLLAYCPLHILRLLLGLVVVPSCFLWWCYLFSNLLRVEGFQVTGTFLSEEMLLSLIKDKCSREVNPPFIFCLTNVCRAVSHVLPARNLSRSHTDELMPYVFLCTEAVVYCSVEFFSCVCQSRWHKGASSGALILYILVFIWI